MSTSKQNRSIFLDQLRGLAIVLMVIFHFSYDLNYFRFVEIDFFRDPLWFYFPRLITFLFLLCVGMSLKITHAKGIKWKKVGKRFLLLSFWAAIFTVATYYLFPNRYIYFGILHCIALSSVVGILFLRIPEISLLIGLPMLVLGVFFDLNIPWFNLPHAAVDYIPFFPWFGAVLMGIFCAHIGLSDLRTQYKILDPLAWLGRYSLRIYLLHQPILFGGLYGIWWLTKNF